MAGFVAVHTGKNIMNCKKNPKITSSKPIGAGNCLDETKYNRVCKEACVKATTILKSGGSTLDACEAAIICLENSGNTNAGFGSNLTWDKQVECEASIMDGTTLQYGACTNVSNIQNPISLARILCERQSKLLTLDRIPPMVLSGKLLALLYLRPPCRQNIGSWGE